MASPVRSSTGATLKGCALGHDLRGHLHEPRVLPGARAACALNHVVHQQAPDQARVLGLVRGGLGRRLNLDGRQGRLANVVRHSGDIGRQPILVGRHPLKLEVEHGPVDAGRQVERDLAGSHQDTLNGMVACIVQSREVNLLRGSTRDAPLLPWIGNPPGVRR